jgi:two-component system chemotaxis response regulator CheB
MQSSQLVDVCGFAQDGNDAIEKVRELKPDVVTLDVDMPGRDGLATISGILDVRPVPIVMVSSLTQQGAKTTLEALSLGAVDFVSKPTDITPDHLRQLQAELVGKIRAVSGRPLSPLRLRRLIAPPQALKQPAPVQNNELPAPAPAPYSDILVAIGISTGGPPALQFVFENLTPPIPPIVVVQHMPSHFTGPFSQRLNQICPFLVKEATEGDVIRPNQILIAAGGRHMTVHRRAGKATVSLDDGELVSGHRPSVDKMFFSAAEAYGSHLVGIIMTGMGRDGADGCKRIVEKGGRTFGQDSATSVVYGMNKVALREGGVQKEFALSDLPEIINNLVRV